MRRNSVGGNYFLDNMALVLGGWPSGDNRNDIAGS